MISRIAGVGGFIISVGLTMFTIGINLHNPISLGRDVRVAINRSAIEQHSASVNPVGKNLIDEVLLASLASSSPVRTAGNSKLE